MPGRSRGMSYAVVSRGPLRSNERCQVTKCGIGNCSVPAPLRTVANHGGEVYLSKPNDLEMSLCRVRSARIPRQIATRPWNSTSTPIVPGPSMLTRTSPHSTKTSPVRSGRYLRNAFQRTKSDFTPLSLVERSLRVSDGKHLSLRTKTLSVPSTLNP